MKKIAFILLVVVVAFLLFASPERDLVSEPVTVKNSQCYHVDCYDSSGDDIGGEMGEWVKSMGARLNDD